MKTLVIMTIIVGFGSVGIIIKRKYENELLFIKFLKNFHSYCTSNISLFKNNIVEIIDNCIIMHKNKNANYIKLFIKNGNLYSFNAEILEKYLTIQDDSVLIFNYLNNLGKGEYLFEREKINEFSDYLNKKIEDCSLNLKNKGELYFKLMLSVGLIISIIIW